MDENKINIAGLDKAEVLAALYNASRPLGMGFLNATAGDMSAEEARKYVDQGVKSELYFDYLQGRVMKVDLAEDSLDPRLYDRDNGPGAAERALAPLLNEPTASAA